MIYLILLAGLWLGLYLSHDYLIYSLLVIIIFLFIFFRIKKKAAVIFVLLCFIGLGISYIRFEFQKEEYTGIVLESKENYLIFSSTLENFYVYDKGNEYEVGDILTIKGEKKSLDFNTIESSFDFKNYLNDKNVYYELDIIDISVHFLTPFKTKAFMKYFLNGFDENNREIISSLLFGISGNDELNKEMNDLHLYRLMNAGGLFVHAYLLLFTFLFKIKFKEDKAKKFALIALLPYFLITMHKFSIFRIFLIQILMTINKKKFNNTFSYIEILALSAFLLLLINPSLAYQDSFILGYLMSFLISFVNNSFYFLTKRKKWTLISVVTFLFFIPFELEYYHSLSFLSPILTILFTPLFILINILNLLCLYFIPLKGVVDLLLNAIISFFKNVNFPRMEIYSPTMPLLVGIVYEVLLIVLLYYLSVRFKPFYKVGFIGMLTILLFNFLPINNYIKDRIYFINVGQGDSALIVHQNKTILIDTGGSTYIDIARECLIPFFKKERIYSIDYLLITHDDYDHSGAKEVLMDNFTVHNYVDKETMFPLKVGDLEIQNLNPYAFKSDRGENDSSLVLRFDFLNYKFLLMGDAGIAIENVLLKSNIDLDIDILKIGHHGSNTSSSYNFIKATSPEIAIISVGKNNKYKHPSFEVINLLKYFNVTIRRTDLEGTICYC